MNAITRPSSSADLLHQAETELLKAIAEHLSGGAIESADWKTEKLRKLGALTAQIEDTIRAYRAAIIRGVNAEVEAAALRQLADTDDLFRMAQAAGATILDALPADSDPALKDIIASWQRTARDQMNIAMAAMLENSGNVYVETLNRASLQVVTGAMSGREALAAAVREWSETGIPSIVDKAGRQWSTEAYANMVIRSNTRRVTTDVSLQRAKEFGADLVEISSHAGARPLCAPYQGKIFSITGTHPVYPPLSSTSMGDPAGLFGINCGHNQYPFFEGLSRQTYAPYDQAENDRVYQESQKQRGMERGIRAAKRELEVFRALKDPKAVSMAEAKLRGRQEALRSFTDEIGRTRRPAREVIYDRPPSSKAAVGAPAAAAPTPPKPTFQPAGSLKEAELWLKESLGLKFASFGKKADLGVVNDWNRGIFEHLTRFPALKDQFTDTGTNQELRRHFVDQFVEAARMKAGGTIDHPTEKYLRKVAGERAGRSNPGNWAMSYNDPLRHGVSINEKVASNPEGLLRALKSSVTTKFHPIGCDTVKSIIDHEMGHQLDKLLGRISKTPEFHNIIANYKVWMDLSGYANTSYAEALAEGWSEYLNNPTPRPLATKIGELVEKKYFERYGGQT